MKWLKTIATAGVVCAVLVSDYLMGNTEQEIDGEQVKVEVKFFFNRNVARKQQTAYTQ